MVESNTLWAQVRRKAWLLLGLLGVTWQASAAAASLLVWECNGHVVQVRINPDTGLFETGARALFELDATGHGMVGPQLRLEESLQPLVRDRSGRFVYGGVMLAEGDMIAQLRQQQGVLLPNTPLLTPSPGLAAHFVTDPEDDARLYAVEQDWGRHQIRIGRYRIGQQGPDTGLLLDRQELGIRLDAQRVVTVAQHGPLVYLVTYPRGGYSNGRQELLYTFLMHAGEWQRLGDPIAVGNSVRQLALSPDGRHAYLLDNNSDEALAEVDIERGYSRITRWDIAQQGPLAGIPQRAQDPAVELDTDAEMLVIGRGGRALYVLASGVDAIDQYAIDAGSGQLQAMQPRSVSTGENSHPSQMVLSDDGRFIYVGLGGRSGLQRWRINPQTRRLEDRQEMQHPALRSSTYRLLPLSFGPLVDPEQPRRGTQWPLREPLPVIPGGWHGLDPIEVPGS